MELVCERVRARMRGNALTIPCAERILIGSLSSGGHHRLLEKAWIEKESSKGSRHEN